MPIRITGMNSNLDTESIITELVKAQKTKVDKLKKEQTRLEWKQDAWKELNSKVYNLFNKTLNKMRWQEAYYKKTTTTSNSSLVSVITGKDAVNGIQKLKIIQEAKIGYLTGAELSGGFTGDSKLSEISPSSFGSGEEGTINVSVGDKTTEIKVDGDTTISDFVGKLREAGVNANFDEGNQRFFVSSQKSGEANDFSLTASNANGAKALEELGLSLSLDDDAATKRYYEKYNNCYVTGDRAATLHNMQGWIDAEIASRVDAYKKSNQEADDSISKLQTEIDDIKNKDGFVPGDTEADLNSRIAALDSDIAALPDGMEKDAKINARNKLQSRLNDVKAIAGKEAEITRLNGVKAENNNYISTDSSGNVTASALLTGEVENIYYDRAEYAHAVISGTAGVAATGANKVNGQDAKIKLNNADFTSNDNSFEINGLTLNILGESSEEITISTQDDTEGIYDMVKSFIKEYNALINEMDKLYNADTAKGYEPLTDEEKDGMSEKEVEKWEQKVKDSVLRRDETISSVTSIMKSVMMAGVEVNGERMYLSDFGIETMNYMLAPENEKNAYHIDGDEDDENTANNADKLKTAIANDPDTVMQFFSGLTMNLYKEMDVMMARSDYSSYNTIYNDKIMKSQYDDYTKRIEEQEKKVTALEDKWYQKFAAMETALARLQSNQSAIAGLLGG